ncbi:MAG: 4-alpha-glucanotransferase [Anaerolineales bacterium]|jgi:4-alpha-glucanotransferase
MTFNRSSGILLHPTSLPGRFGIGDLGPWAFEWVDFLDSTGTSLWQVLPLGPTGYADSPYQCFSAMAGNPYLISPERLVADGLLDNADIAAPPVFPMEQVDYGKVISWKVDLLQRAYRKHKSTGILKEEFAIYREENNKWLEDFALFMAMKQAHNLKPWVDWPAALRDRQPQAIDAFRDTNRGGIIEQHAFDQFLFYRQWTAVKQHANERGIQIIGDIPIYVAHDSSDVWSNRELFQLDETGQPIVVAGVPPDYFSETGQLWGNPIYKWDLHAVSDYAWWKQRIEMVLKQVDVIRLDHFRGFAGYWEVPATETTAVNGRWMPGPGAKIFKELKDYLEELPLIAEDLGYITPDVHALREQFNLPGMKIFQFGLEEGNEDPFVPHNYEEHCVAYTGTHDNDTSAGWYSSASPDHQAFARYYLNLGENPTNLEFTWAMIHRLWQSAAVFVLAPMQDFLGLGTEARMNYPGTTSGNWQWRMRKEALSQELADKLTRINQEANRS